MFGSVHAFETRIGTHPVNAQEKPFLERLFGEHLTRGRTLEDIRDMSAKISFL